MDDEGTKTRHSGPIYAFVLITLVWFGWSYVVQPQLSSFAGELGGSLIYSGWSFLALGYAVWVVTRPGAERAWIPLVIGLAGSTLGDLLWDLTDRGILPGGNQSPAPVDLLYLPAYLALIWTTLRLVARYHQAGAGSVLDTFVVAAGPVAAAFPLLVGPYVPGLTTGSTASRALDVFYPLGDLLIAAALIALALGLGRLSSLRWLGLAFGLALVADHVYLAQAARGTYVGGSWLDWMWLVQYSLIALTARQKLPTSLPARTAREDAVYLAGLLGCALLCPAVLVVRLGLGTGNALTDLVYAIATLALISAVSVRLIGLVAENQRTVHRLSDALVEREQLSRDLRHQASHDVVTGLPNRQYLASAIEALESSPDVVHSVIFVDLDDFKAVNDTYGHAVGDSLLQAVTARFRAETGPGALVSRLGGDEFAVLLPATPVGRAVDVARRTLDALRLPVPFEGNLLTVTATAGIAGIGHGFGGWADALARADLAMYAAKRAGKDRVLAYSEEMRDQVLGDAEIAADLVQAVHGGEITAHFQPIVDLATGRVTGAEALARWERGGVNLSPDVFLPVAEQRGLISEIDLQMLEQALSYVREWRLANPAMRVAFNMSTALLARDDVVQQVLSTLARHGLPGSVLTVEITEQGVISDPTGAAGKLKALRARGIWIALDDFGSGYSSLSYLQRLPVDVMKLDRTFVQEAIVHGRATPLLGLVVDLGRKLGMRVLAEGVETVEQLSVVHAAGCVVGQGWLFARAVPAADLGLLLTGSLIPVAARTATSEVTASAAPVTVPIPLLP